MELDRKLKRVQMESKAVEREREIPNPCIRSVVTTQRTPHTDDHPSLHANLFHTLVTGVLVVTRCPLAHCVGGGRGIKAWTHKEELPWWFACMHGMVMLGVVAMSVSAVGLELEDRAELGRPCKRTG